MTAIANYLQAHWLDWLHGASAAIVTWIATGWLAAPLREFLTDRRNAIEAVQQYGAFDSFMASEEGVKAALAALGTAAKQMLYYAQGGPGVVRIYARLRRYDLHLAGRALNGLFDMISSGRRPPDYQRDAVRICLGADRLIPVDRRRAIRLLLASAEHDSDAVEPDRTA